MPINKKNLKLKLDLGEKNVEDAIPRNRFVTEHGVGTTFIDSYRTFFTESITPGAYATVIYHDLISPGGSSSLQIVKKEGGEHVFREIKIFELIASNPESSKKAIIKPISYKLDPYVNLIYLPFMPGGNLQKQKTYIYENLRNHNDEAVLAWLHKQIIALLEALKHLHTQDFMDDTCQYSGIVHGDIKPDNILINNKGNVILADLGCAYPLAKPAKEFGNLRYMAPEISANGNFRMEPIKDIEKSDIWSLGVVLYLLLHNKYPSFSPKYSTNPSCLTSWRNNYSDSILAKQAREAKIRLNKATSLFNTTTPIFTLNMLHDLSLVMLLPINERPSTEQLLNKIHRIVPLYCSEEGCNEFVATLLAPSQLKGTSSSPSSYCP